MSNVYSDAEASLDLHSASEEDEEEVFTRGRAHHSEDDMDEDMEDEQQEDEQESEKDEPVQISKASVAYRAPRSGSQGESKPLPKQNDDDSETGDCVDLESSLPYMFNIAVESDSDFCPVPAKLAPPLQAKTPAVQGML